MKTSCPWPEALPPEDPWAEDEAAPHDPGLARLVGEVRAGRAPLHELAARLGPLRHDHRPLPRIDSVPSADDLLRIGVDLVAHLAAEAPDRVLGPFAASADPRCPAHRRALVNAVAWAAFVAERPGAPSAVQRWSRRQPLPTVEDRARVRSVAWAPGAIWILERRVGARWELRDRTGLAAESQPDGPVLLQPIGAVAGEDVGEGGAIAARVVPSLDGPVAVAPLAVPFAPPAEAVAAWVLLEVGSAAAAGERAEVEDVLRRRGHVLARRLHEWAYSLL